MEKNVSSAHEEADVSKESDSTRNVDLRYSYELQNIEQFKSKINAEHVTYLNVSHCFWLPINELRDFVASLSNLEVLSAFRTNLHLADQDLLAYQKTKINKLGLTLNSVLFNEKLQVPTVTTFSFEMSAYKEDLKTCEIPKLKTIFPQLEKLWFKWYQKEPRTFDGSKQGVFKWIDSQELKYLKKLNISSNEYACFMFAPKEDAGMKLFYAGRKYGQDKTACFDTFDVSKLEMPPLWKECLDGEETNCEIPWGPNDARRLYLKEETLETISFEEFNCRHDDQCCRDEGAAFQQMLLMPNTRHVKKLAIPNCLLKIPFSLTIGRNQKKIKRQKTQLSSLGTSLRGNILNHFTDITHLELYVCHNDSDWYEPHGLPKCSLISNFTQLKTLYMEIPPTNDSQCLKDVLKKCVHIETLWVTAHQFYESQNETLNQVMISALTSAACKDLKEFTFQNKRLSVDSMLKVLKRFKLRKLSLAADKTNEFTAQVFKDYLGQNPQLMTCILNIGLDANQMKMAEETFESFKKPYTIFKINKDIFNIDEDPATGGSFFFRSSVSNLNLEEGFETF